MKELYIGVCLMILSCGKLLGPFGFFIKYYHEKKIDIYVYM